MTIEHQDKEIIIVNPYTWTGTPDGIYIKVDSPIWAYSTYGDNYKLLLNRNKTIIEVKNEFYEAKYSAIESSLIGDVLILGAGLQILDTYLVTGSSWKWVEKNTYLNTLIPANGTIHQGNAEDMEFLLTLGTFDTILIDFPQSQLNDYTSLLNIGGTIIEMMI